MSVPIKKFNAGAVQIAIWENEGKEGNPYNTVSLQKSYKDSKGEWKNNGSLKVNDIPKAILALEKAYEFIMLKEPKQSEGKTLAMAME